MSIKSLLGRASAFLRNRPCKPGAVPCRPFRDLINRTDPWYTDAYWAAYRFFHNTAIFHPARICREIKWFVQRGRRGWADRDTWSLDWYLNGWMPDALRYLKEHKHGTPMSVFPTEACYIAPDGNPTDAAHDIAARRWDEILGKIIAGFEASRRINDGLYEDELGPYPSRGSASRIAATRLLEERDEKTRLEGFALFAEHYHSFWD